MQKSFDISAISFHRMMQVLYKMDAMSDWGSILGLTYIAAQRTFPDYSEMAESKALLESFARSFGYHWALKKHVRVNTISQSPTKTTAGSGVKGFDEFYDYADKMSPLGNASADACADYCVALFSDMTRMVTMQNLYHDGGFSSMGMSPAILGL
jgi:enoyl-[acyl-carrier protein] reductase I